MVKISDLKSKLRVLKKLITNSKNSIEREMIKEKSEVKFMENVVRNLKEANSSLKSARNSNLANFFKKNQCQIEQKYLTRRKNRESKRFGSREKSWDFRKEFEENFMNFLSKMKNAKDNSNIFRIDEEFKTSPRGRGNDGLMSTRREGKIFQTERDHKNRYIHIRTNRTMEERNYSKTPRVENLDDFYKSKFIEREKIDEMKKIPKKTIGISIEKRKKKKVSESLKKIKKRCFSQYIFSERKGNKEEHKKPESPVTRSRARERFKEDKMLKEQKSMPNFENSYDLGKEYKALINNYKPDKLRLSVKEGKRVSKYHRLKRKINSIVQSSNVNIRQDGSKG